MEPRHAGILQTRRRCPSKIMETFPKIPEPVILEHQIAEMMQDQKRVGWPFDVRKA